MGPTIVRFVESFLFFLVATFVSNLAVLGHALDITSADGQAEILTVFLGALAIAFRRAQAASSSSPPSP